MQGNVECRDRIVTTTCCQIKVAFRQPPSDAIGRKLYRHSKLTTRYGRIVARPCEQRGIQVRVRIVRIPRETSGNCFGSALGIA